MFWRVLTQLLRASRGRLLLALLAVVSGAAVTTALLNLQWDASRKLSAEFRTLGANLLVLPREAAPGSADGTERPLEGDQVATRVQQLLPPSATSAPYLYIVANLSAGSTASAWAPVIVAGTWLDRSPKLAPWWSIQGQSIAERDDQSDCLVGVAVARQFSLQPGSELELGYGPVSAPARVEKFRVSGVITSGGEEDSQIFANLAAVERLAALEGRIGLVEVSVPGTNEEVTATMRRLAFALPQLDIRPVRQLAEAEGQLLSKLRGLILAMVALILALTALCVLASMAALAMERRRDVGTMKALGGSISRIVAIFLTEVSVLGALGAVAGYALGIQLSRWIGYRAFGVAIAARPEVLPLVMAVMVGVSLVAAFPLRLLGRLRPAEILRGE
jgi:putative ABC transport system permease protein